MTRMNGVTRTTLMLLLLLLSGGTVFSQVTTRVLDWNVHGSKFCPPHKAKCAFQGMKSHDELNQLVKVMKDSGAGTVTLQEIFKPQADYIANRLLGRQDGCYQDKGIGQVEHVKAHVQRPVHCYFVATKEYGAHPDYGDAIISFRPISETTARRIHTQHNPNINCRTKGDVVDELCDGTFAKLTGVTINANDRLLRVYTVHLTANPSDPAERDRQLNWQLSDVLEVIRRDNARAQGRYRAVLTGDFNFEPPADVNNPPPGPYRRLAEKFEDAWVKGNPCPPNSGRTCGGTEPAPTTQHPTNNAHRRIDYVFLYKGSGFNLKDIRVLRTESCKAPNGPCLSDHLPISATITF
jgi:endonuclease/exonuclease/phosphatase family metal-dependent hydrolase